MSRGVLGKGTESFTTRPETCGAAVAPGETTCKRHLAVAARLEAKLDWKRRNAR